MNKNLFVKPVAVTAGLLFLCVSPGLTYGQNAAPGAAQTPNTVSPAAQPKKDTHPPDLYAGMTFTDEQKTKIYQITQNAKVRVDAVNKDEKLDSYQKQAMLDGFRRIEVSEIFKVLTPEQQVEVRKRMSAQRAAEQQAEQKKKKTVPQ
jgi:Spy/CpxP family protein refolding chaperone